MEISRRVGQMISSYLTNQSCLDDRAIHLLFSANCWEKKLLIEPKLRSGTTLIVDHYAFSGIAFSSANGLDVEWCKVEKLRVYCLSKSLLNWCETHIMLLLHILSREAGLPAPDLVLYLDTSPEKAAERGGDRGERYEKLEFQKGVTQSYKML